MDNDLNKIALIFSALGHKSRLLIIKALEEKEHCVCDLKNIIGSEMSTVSKHLTVLKNANLVSCRKEANQVFYKLSYPCVSDFIKCLEVKK